MKRDYPFIACVAAAWLLIIALFVLLTVKARAQIAPGALHRLIGNPSAGTPGFTIPQYTNIVADLRDGDLANGMATTWTSRVNGFIWTNTVSGPIKEASGLHFYGTNFLNCTNNSEIILYLTNAFCVVYKNDNTTAAAWKTVTGAVSAERGLMYKADVFEVYHVTGDMTLITAAKYVTNKWIDVIYSGGTNSICYTNGVPSYTNTVAATTVTAYPLIGCNQAGHVDVWKGYIRDIKTWTNTPAVGFTSSEVASLHSWLTNEYPSVTP